MKKEDKKLVAEKNYPLVGSVVLTLIIVGMSFVIELKDDILTAVNAVLVVVSILLGFIGVLVGLIFAQSDNEILSVVFISEHLINLLKKYFVSVYRTGFVVLGLSIGMFFKETVNQIILDKVGMIFKECHIVYIDKVFVYLWILFLIWFLLATYRLVKIVVDLIFQKKKEPEKLQPDVKDYTSLENKYINNDAH